MIERRKEKRTDFVIKITDYFDLLTEVKGHFKNREPFILKNVSLGGFSLISTYLPDIGPDELVYMEKEGGMIEFAVQIIHANIVQFKTDRLDVFKPGILYSIGCKIKDLSDVQKEYIKHQIINKSDFMEKKSSFPTDYPE